MTTALQLLEDETTRAAVGAPLDRQVRPHVVPITLREASDFIARHHRHNKPPRGWKFGVGLRAGADLEIGRAHV